MESSILVDSIASVWVPWCNVSTEIGQDQAHLIAATHAKRAIGSLRQFNLHTPPNYSDDEVGDFDQTILDSADEYNQKASSYQLPAAPRPPSLTRASNGLCSRRWSISEMLFVSFSQRPSLAKHDLYEVMFRDEVAGLTVPEWAIEDESTAGELDNQACNVWKVGAEPVGQPIRTLPGICRVIDFILKGFHTTSGAKAYGRYR